MQPLYKNQSRFIARQGSIAAPAGVAALAVIEDFETDRCGDNLRANTRGRAFSPSRGRGEGTKRLSCSAARCINQRRVAARQRPLRPSAAR